MWRMTPRLATAALTATLALVSAPAPEARSATVTSYQYTTDPNISDMIGTQPIELVGTSGSLTTPGSFVLGTFQANPLPSTATLTYNSTPFTIDLYVSTPPPVSAWPTLSPTVEPVYDYQISGVLNGSITGAGWSDMVATITSVSGFGGNPPFPISDLVIATPQGIAAPNGNTPGVSMLTGQVVPDPTGPTNPTPAPEPATILVLGGAAAGYLLRRKLGGRTRIDG